MNKTSLRLGVIAVAAVSTLALSACSSGGGGTSTPAADGEFVPAFAFITGDISDFGQVQIDGMESVVEPLGGAITVFDGGNDPESQNADCLDIVSSGQYNGILLNASSGPGAIPCVTAAQEAGIPVAAVETVIGPDETETAPQVEGVVISAAPSQRTNGEVATELLQDACADFDPCNYIQIVGSPAYQLEATKLDVMEEAIGGDARYNRLALGEDGYNPEKARQVVADLVAANPSVNVIMNSSDSSAVQVIALLDELGRDDVVVVGDGASRQGVEALKAGTLFGTTRLAPFSIGEVAAQGLVDYNLGNPTLTPEEVGVLLDPIVFTADTIGDYEGQWG